MIQQVARILLLGLFLAIGTANAVRAVEPVTLPQKEVKILPTKEVVIIAWVNSAAVTLPTLEDGVNPILRAALDDPLACGAVVGQWFTGLRTHILTDIDRVYANAFLVKNSGNQSPPNTITSAQEQADGDYRLFQKFKAAIRSKDNEVLPAPKFLGVSTIVGSTPDPCIIPTAIWTAAGEVDVANAEKGVTVSKDGVFQVNQGRIGVAGQAVDTTLNNPGGVVGETTPWIWSVAKFDSNGDLKFPFPIGARSSHQIFPTYYVYEDGQLRSVHPQNPTEAFIAFGSDSKISVPIQ